MSGSSIEGGAGLVFSELKSWNLIYGFQKQGGIVSTEAEGVA